jgi:hypothetical protein
MVVAPKYRLRGFWEIPAPKQSSYGEQPVVKFLISYRYLSKTGATGSVKEMPYYDKTGKSNTATFSNWVEIETKGRQKVRDPETSFYYWADEDTKNPDVININQLDIPINKGESVEVRIKSISAAGYPDNPWMSDWSDSVVITFPEKFEMKDDHEVITQKLLVDESVLNFTAELSAKNLDLHLSDGFVKGNRYMSHKLSSVFSGWYDAAGEMLDAEQKIRLLEDRIAALENAINKAKGTIKVTVIDTNGNVIAVNSGNTISLFAGYYKDIITDNTGLDDGDIITASYVISIENTSQTPLELVSRLTGGIDEHVLESAGYSDDYGQNRKYDLTSLMVSGNPVPETGSFKQKQPFQSGHARSQPLKS